MKVTLVRPNSKLTATTLPLGMGYIADAARKAGHQVDMLDARFERLSPDETARRVLAENPDIIGISAIHFEKKGTLDLITALTSQGNRVPVVVGGPLVATSGKELVSAGHVDAAIVGEGENSFVAYLDALSGGGGFSNVPGIIYRDNGGTVENEAGPFLDDLDTRLPAWDLVGPEKYFTSFGRSSLNMLQRSPRSASIFTSRGCPFGCFYCHNTFGRKFRPRSPESVLEEIKMLVRDYNIKELEIVDDAFNVKLDRAKEIARMIASEGLGLSISFSNGLRADRMDEELIDLLKKAGTYRINYAVETASPRLQKLIHKNLDLDKTMKVMEYTAGKGIFILGYFMLGFPTETEEEMRMTLDYAIRSKLHAASFFYVNPFPGTELARLYGEGVDPGAVEKMDYTDLKINMSEVPDEVLRRISKEAYRKFHFAPDRMWRTFRVVPMNFRTIKSVAIIAMLSIRDVGNF